MGINGTEGVLGAAYPHAGIAPEAAVSGASFLNRLQSMAKTRKSSVEQYQDYLSSKYGANVSVQSVGKDQKSMDTLGAATAGLGNVVIAPNIMEEMINNPERAAHYEGVIQWHFDTLPKLEAELSAMGHEIHSCGIVIHSDGTVTRYVTGDLKPEVRARIEAQVKAEQEEKAKRRKEYMELGKEAAEKRKLEWELALERQYHAVNTGIVPYVKSPEAKRPVLLSMERLQ